MCVGHNPLGAGPRENSKAKEQEICSAEVRFHSLHLSELQFLWPYYCPLGSSCPVPQTESHIIAFLILRPLTLNRALLLTSSFSSLLSARHETFRKTRGNFHSKYLLIIKYIISHHINLSFHCPPTHLFIFRRLGFSGEL